MGIQSYLKRVSKATSDIKDAINTKGGSCSECDSIEVLANAVLAIPTGTSDSGDALFTVLAFKSTTSQPSTPSGGSWSSSATSISYPSGWSDGSGMTSDVWMSYKVYKADGSVYKDWVSPIKVSGTSSSSSIDLSDYATQEWVTAQIAKISTGGTVDLSSYATKSWVEDQNYLTNVDLSSYALKTWVTEQIERIDSGESMTLNGLSGAVSILAGDNISIAKSATNNSITISAKSSGSTGSGKDGDDGDTYRTFQIYQYNDSRTTAPTISDGASAYWDTENNELANCPSGWSTDEVYDADKYLWISSATFSKKSAGAIIGSWATPCCITGPKGKDGTDGEDGTDGKDGSTFEFIYALTADENVTPAYPNSATDLKTLFDAAEANGNATYNSQIWYDRAQSIDGKTFKTCWMAHRIKLSGASDWTYDTTPIIWSNWGSDGKDGDGVEYIFFLTDTAEQKSDGSWTSDAEGFSNYASTASGTVNGVVTAYSNTVNDWVPTGWTDEPQDASPNKGLYEFCSIRRSNNGVWGAFTTPALWSKSATDGKDGADVEYVFALIDVQCTADQVTVENKEEYKTVSEALPRFKFIETYVQSTDDPQSVSSEYPYQWVSVRRKPAGQTTWNDFSEPSLWNNYTKAALDEDSLNELKDTAEQIANEAVQTATESLTKATNDISEIQEALGYKDGTYINVSDLSSTVGEYKSKTDENSENLSEVSTQYSKLVQTVNGFETRVGNVESSVSKKADNDAVITLTDRVSGVEQAAEKISASVTSLTTKLSTKADADDIPDVSGFLTKNDADNTYATISQLETSTLTMESDHATLANVQTNFDDLAEGFVSVNSKISYFGNAAGKYMMNSDDHYINSDGYLIYITPSAYTDALDDNGNYDSTKVSAVYSKDGVTFYIKKYDEDESGNILETYSYEESTTYSSSNTKLLGTWNLADYIGKDTTIDEFNAKYTSTDTIPEGFSVGELTKEAKQLHLQMQKVVSRNADEVAHYAELVVDAVAAIQTEVEDNSATITLNALAEGGKLAQMVLGSIKGTDSESTFVNLVADSFNAPDTVFSVKELKTEIEAQPDGSSTTQTYHLYAGDKYDLKVADKYVESPIASKYSGIFNSKGTYIGIYEGNPFTVTSDMATVGVSSFTTSYSNFITSRTYQHVSCFVELVSVDDSYVSRTTNGTWDLSYNHGNEWDLPAAEAVLLNEVYTKTYSNSSKIASWRFSTDAEKGRGEGKTVTSETTFKGATFTVGSSTSVSSDSNDTMPTSAITGTLKAGTYAFRIIWLGCHSGRNSFHVSHANVYLDNTIKVTLTTNTEEDQVGVYLSPQGFMLSTPDKQQISMGIDDNGKLFSKGIVRSTSNIAGSTSVNNIVVISEADITSATDSDTLYIILSE
jgi:hypothetical protein